MRAGEEAEKRRRELSEDPAVNAPCTCDSSVRAGEEAEKRRRELSEDPAVNAPWVETVAQCLQTVFNKILDPGLVGKTSLLGTRLDKQVLSRQVLGP